MEPELDLFPTAFYESHNIPCCPNGDALRSDDDGLFCWIDGARVAALLVDGVVLVEEPTEPEPEQKKAGGRKNANG